MAAASPIVTFVHFAIPTFHLPKADDESLADVTLTFPGTEEVIKANRIILAASSPVWKSMFCQDFEENEAATVEIKDFSIECMKLFKDFIHSAGIRIPDHKLGIELHSCAHFYQMDELLDFTRIYLIQTFPKVNVVDIIREAELRGSPQLKNAQIYLIQTVSKDNVVDIIQQTELRGNSLLKKACLYVLKTNKIDDIAKFEELTDGTILLQILKFIKKVA